MKKIDKSWTCIGEVMSNFDHIINEDIANKLLQPNTYGEYPAWNFFSKVWYETENNKYYAVIKQYGTHIDTIVGDSLKKF